LIEIYTANGKLVKKFISENKFLLNKNDFASGIYIIQIDNTARSKFIVQ